MTTPTRARRTVPRRSGPLTLYPGKVRGRTASAALTAEGWALLLAALAESGLSQSDYLEDLVRRDARRRGGRATVADRPRT